MKWAPKAEPQLSSTRLDSTWRKPLATGDSFAPLLGHKRQTNRQTEPQTTHKY